MILFLDAEFNGFGGELISIALVPMNGAPFYECVQLTSPPEKWVAENVLPNLDKQPISVDELLFKIRKYLELWNEVTIIADWPEDIAHLCSLLTIGPKLNIENVSIVMALIDQPPNDFESETTRHNALNDAKRLGRWYIKNYLGGCI